MKEEDMEKYISNLSPELQEKARACKSIDELKELISENDIELSEDILEAVSGGGCSCKDRHPKGYPMGSCCTECHCVLKYWDNTWREGSRMYCDNPKCSSYNNGLWWVPAWAAESKRETWYPDPEKY